MTAGYAFVSYSRHDTPYVEKLVAYLQAEGIDVWYDAELGGGDRWERTIKRQIEACGIMLVVMSPYADDSIMVANEVDLARDRDKLIAPLLLAGEPFFSLRHAHYEDVRGGAMPSPRFVQRLKQVLDTQDSVAPHHAKGGSARVGSKPLELPQPRTLPGHRSKVRHLAIAPDGTWLVTTGSDGVACIWDPVSGQLRHTLRGSTRSTWISSCAIAPDGTWLITTGSDGAARIWDSATGQLRHTLRARTIWMHYVHDFLSPSGDWVLSCAIAPDGTWLATTGSDGLARIWDPTAGELRRTLRHPLFIDVRRCAIGPDATWLITVSADGIGRIWEPTTGQLRLTLGHAGPASGCAIAPDGTWLVTTSHDGTIHIWPVAW